MEKKYNKLVRDNIPNIISNDNEIPITRILSDDELKTELYKKLSEECKEVLNSKTKKETIEELADILEVIKSIAKLNGEGLEKIINIANEKRLKKGGFDKKNYLEKTIYDDKNL